MSDLILHHYELSPFSIKIRRMLAHKKLPYRAVTQPSVAPKPELTPLTGGYRRIPVLQIGAHVYCDTALIAREIERRHPETPLTTPEWHGMAELLASWADRTLFGMVAPVVIGEVLPMLPENFVADRAAMSPNFASDQLAKAVPHYAAQLQQVWPHVEAQLAGKDYLFGSQLSLADLSAYHVINFCRLAPKFGQTLAPYQNIGAWLARIDALGDGDLTDLSGEEALQIARDAAPDQAAPADAQAADGLAVGTDISIQADDFGLETTTGRVLWTRANEIAVLRADPSFGDIVVHFPRAGYRFTAQK